MQAYFLRLYVYNHWANQKYLEVFRDMDIVPERVQLLMSHVLVAQKLWLTRIQGNPDLSLHIWKILPIEQLEELAQENTRQWVSYLQNADNQEVERVLSYYNFLNNYYETPVGDIISHTANHATYHRAQMAVLLRQAGIAPPNTDFITYSRETGHQTLLPDFI